MQEKQKRAKGEKSFWIRFECVAHFALDLSCVFVYLCMFIVSVSGKTDALRYVFNAFWFFFFHSFVVVVALPVKCQNTFPIFMFSCLVIEFICHNFLRFSFFWKQQKISTICFGRCLLVACTIDLTLLTKCSFYHFFVDFVKLFWICCFSRLFNLTLRNMNSSITIYYCTQIYENTPHFIFNHANKSETAPSQMK